MKDIEAIIGKTFNFLTVVGVSNKKGFAIAKCDCGVEKAILAWAIKSGNTKSCGCKKSELSRRANVTHGKTNDRIYHIWQNMKARCYNEKNTKYKFYGGRGVTVCEDWKNSFESFFNWAVEFGYKPQLTIDRINNNKGYSPENCRWVSQKEQANNTRRNRYLIYQGKKLTIAQWADIAPIGSINFQNRIEKGWSINDAMAVPFGVRRSLFNNKQLNP